MYMTILVIIMGVLTVAAIVEAFYRDGCGTALWVGAIFLILMAVLVIMLPKANKELRQRDARLQTMSMIEYAVEYEAGKQGTFPATTAVTTSGVNLREHPSTSSTHPADAAA